MTDGAAEPEYVTTDDGLRLALRRHGDAGPIVIVPSLSWLGADLRPLAEHVQLVCYDHRGQGRSDRATDRQIGFERDVADLECIRAGIGAERIALLGWSYHGAVAARFAWAHADRVERMVLVGPVAPRAAPHWREYLQAFGGSLDVARLRELETQRRAGLKDRDPAAFCRAHTDLILRVYVADPSCLLAMKSSPCVQPNLDPEIVNKQMLRVIEGMGDYDWRDEMAGLAVPTLILHGDHDPVPLQGSREWTEVLADVRLTVLEGCGHLPWLEQPDRFFPQVEAFLRKPA